MNTMLSERHELNKIALLELKKDVEETREFSSYFSKMADLLLYVNEIYDTKERTLEQLKQWNRIWYEEISQEQYAHSFGNPKFCTEKFGKEYGQIFAFLYAEMRSGFIYAIEGRLFDLVINNELFLEISNLFLSGEEHPQKIKHIVFDHMRDYSEDVFEYRIREQLDPELDFATKIVMESDLSDPDILYQYGEYISENELETASHLNTLSQAKIQAMAATYTEGFRKGFELYNIDLSAKKTVNIRFSLGFEQIVRAAIRQFAQMDLDCCIYRAGVSMTTRSARGRIGYFGASANKQYDYDHRMDNALIFDKAYADRCLTEQRSAYQDMKDLAATYAGPAVIETFGEHPFIPENKSTTPKDSDKQRSKRLDYQAASTELTNEFIPGDQVSFTIIAFPVPEIGQNFTDIFDATIRVNTLDQERYEQIQTTIIEALDSGESVTVTGRNGNHTNITVALTPMTDPARQTRFENCLADVNIPLGEVFTSPKLKGTNGILHVTKSFLNGLKYENICLTFQDGVVTDYECSNYDSEEQNKKYIFENLLFQHKTLPMGEFAIGTNTTAYAMGQQFGISHLLPILIEEKTGPHFAIGDTCFSHEEELRTYNPDGKEMIAKENDYSLLRHTDSRHAYFGCHTDITIPYHELGDIIVNGRDGRKIPIIKEGRFVLPGTETLNEPLR